MSDETLQCVIEIPRGSRNKYEFDPEIGAIKLDRLRKSLHESPEAKRAVPPACSRSATRERLPSARTELAVASAFCWSPFSEVVAFAARSVKKRTI